MCDKNCDMKMVNCPRCRYPCKVCGIPCFDNQCYKCDKNRFIPCTRCTDLVWDGKPENCLCKYSTDEDLVEYLQLVKEEGNVNILELRYFNR